MPDEELEQLRAEVKKLREEVDAIKEALELEPVDPLLAATAPFRERVDKRRERRRAMGAHRP